MNHESRLEKLERERSEMYYWFEHHHVTGDLSLEQIDAMSTRDMADHAYDRIYDKLCAANDRIAELLASYDELKGKQ
jgi:hypothetical protein